MECAFGQIGEGNLRMNFIVPRDRFADLEYRLLDLVYSEIDKLQSSISAEHGAGRMKREAIAKRKAGVRLDVMNTIKLTIDPDNRFNPHVMIQSKKSAEHNS